MSDNAKNRESEFFKSLPKVELHRHLEGSINLSTMLEIAKSHQLDLPYEDVAQFQPLVQVMDTDDYTFQNFLSKFASIRKFFQSPEVIKQITREVIADAAADNVRYLELRFTPVALTRIGGYPLGDAIDWVIEASDAASKEFGITTRLIASVNRHESVELAEEVMQQAVARMDRGVVALDLAGSENDFPGEEFAGIFSEAKDAGLAVTIHAGEWGGPEIIQLAVDKLSAERIGHGVRVLEDPDVTAMAKERQIVFEVCPTSNYQSGVITSLDQHPLVKMIEAGLQVTINTDDPGLSQITLSNEYQLACETLGLELPALRASVLTAAQASFLPEKEKQPLVTSLEKELNS
ncbi:MAG: adenosine deaminase [Chloroflexota bacterium]